MCTCLYVTYKRATRGYFIGSLLFGYKICEKTTTYPRMEDVSRMFALRALRGLHLDLQKRVFYLIYPRQSQIDAEVRMIRSHEIVLRNAVAEANSAIINFTPTDMKVVTMNIMATTSLTGRGKIAKALIIDHFEKNLNNVPGVGLKRDSRKRRRKNAVDFGNSVALAYEHRTLKNRVCAKVFTNGKFQVSGCQNIDDFVSVAKIICVVLSNILASTISLVGFKIGLMNIACYVRIDGDSRVALDLKEIEIGLKDKDYWRAQGTGPLESVERSADRAPAIMIKYRADKTRKAITGMVYKCGRMVFMGLNRHSDAVAIHKFIVDFLDIHWLMIACEKMD